MSRSASQKRLRDLGDRAVVFWEKAPFDTSDVSVLLGSSEHDVLGEECWQNLGLSSFVAPNIYLNWEDPVLLEALNCVEMGSDRNDCPLYYFLEVGAYAISTNLGLLFLAQSTLELFEAFVLYAEWVEEVLQNRGSNAVVDSKYSRSDIANLEERLTLLLNDDYAGSYWQQDVTRLTSDLGVG